jgi:hypothetical protein
MITSMERDSDVWLGWSWWAAGARWGDYMFSLEPKNGKDRPQMAWLQPHLPGAKPPQFAVSVKNGTGTCLAKVCTACTVEAISNDKKEVFSKWTGDTAWLKDLKSSKTSILVPFKNVEVEAVFEKVPHLAAMP